ncbi:MAG: PCMD domain-containing protein [Bacteroidetes bacterium]|nr:PCMD domain-containing protein [Bacteroidota bacterium]
MKQTFIFIFTLILIKATFGQTMVLPNGGFEAWHQVQGIDSVFMEPDSNFFSTLNELANTPAIGAGSGPITVYRTTDAHSGTYAAKLVSKNFPYIPKDIFIPGMLGTTKLIILQSTIKIGKPCPYGCHPQHFTGWFKYFPVNNDSCKVAIVVSQFNTSTHKRDTIGYGEMIYHEAYNTYTQFDIPVVYRNQTMTPDSLSILAVSSAGFNLGDLQAGVGQVSSTLYVDDFMVEYPAGIQQFMMPDVTINTYPVPARDLLKVELSKVVKNGLLEVFAMDGKKMARYSLIKDKNTIPVYNLTNGTYYYKLTDGKTVLNTGSFMIKR